MKSALFLFFIAAAASFAGAQNESPEAAAPEANNLILQAQAQAKSGGVSSGVKTESPHLQNICGNKDLRSPSNFKPNGRLRSDFSQGMHCSGTLISRSCVVSAAHCMEDIEYVEFNVPESSESGLMRSSAEEDRYEIGDAFGIEGMKIEAGKDWAVFRLKKNKKTHRYAGEVPGYYPVLFENLSSFQGHVVRASGFGEGAGSLNYSQQTSTGTLFVDESQPIIRFDIYATHGSSGSGVILEENKRLVGVLRRSGCDQKEDPLNSGTSVWNNPEFKKAVEECLASEK
jgi:V8-like Glu-specific endopeptidase